MGTRTGVSRRLLSARGHHWGQPRRCSGNRGARPPWRSSSAMPSVRIVRPRCLRYSARLVCRHNFRPPMQAHAHARAGAHTHRGAITRPLYLSLLLMLAVLAGTAVDKPPAHAPRRKSHGIQCNMTHCIHPSSYNVAHSIQHIQHDKLKTPNNVTHGIQRTT
jgi:hypothetical protein